MLNIWCHYNPVRITSGPGSLSRLHELVPSKGDVLLVTTAGATKRGMTSKICYLLGQDRVTVHDRITPNPDLDDLDRASRQYRQKDICGILALGGGSVLDAAKVLGAILRSENMRPLDSIFRQGLKDVFRNSIPVTAVPTTAGTGAEVTPFATVWDSKNKKKHSLAGEHLYPAYALLDPKLTLTLPYYQSLYTGLDAVSHALESLWNKNRTPVSETYALQALSLANRALPIILEQPESMENRSMMLQASLLAGLAISQTRTAIAHAISYPLTIHYGVPHGLGCGFTLPELIDKYVAYLKDRKEKHILISTKKTIKTLNLTQEIVKYLKNFCSFAHLDEMLKEDRANNFSEELSQKEVEEILFKSLQ